MQSPASARYSRLIKAAAAGLLAWAFWTAPTPAVLAEGLGDGAAATTPAAAAGTAISAEENLALDQALDLERKRDWAAALNAYSDALQKWPQRAEFRHRQRLCEIHYRLNRRYQDLSFHKVLLKLNLDQALALHDELLERIEIHYVEPVRLEPLIRRGIDNLEVALRDPTFIKAHIPGAAADRLTEVRNELRSGRGKLVANNRADAREWVLWSYGLCRDRLGLSAAPVILEFAFGACDALDDYTTYLTPDKLEDLYAMIDGNFVGLGVELKLDRDSLLLLGVIRGGPAAEAGLKTGERITKVGDRVVAGLSLDEAASLLQGEDGSRVRLSVKDRSGKVRELALTRRAVEVESVPQAKILEPKSGVAYIQLTGFQKSSTNELQGAIARLEREGMRALVLDLRGNPGGLLNVAVEIADRFLNQGLIVTTRGRTSDQSEGYRASGRPSWRMPLAILVDHDSASASEILAGALQENRRAIVLGERSYGKGSVQSIYSLRSVPAGLKLTTAKFYSPLGRAYSEQGVAPDFAIRTAAKPAAGAGEPATEPAELGDPTNDTTLAQAILVVRRELLGKR